ncbi:apicoplast pyruvate carrier 1-like isoform X2 [Tachypleus tridentatus]|uniref:apicoplast pyruvate carrier 1-like isoform X2 n=1 Tax=Tachypleus tridentatus TaxID=6853 RepID=UPI003FD0A025
MKVRPYVSVTGCFLICMAIGALLTFGNLTPYLTSYLRKRVKKDTTYEETSWIFYAFIFTCSLLFFGGKLGCLIGRRRSIIIGSFIFCIGIAVTYWSVQHSLVATIITYGVVDTMGFVCCFGHPIVTAIEWFPNNKGLLTGIVTSGIALTPIYMNSVQTFFVNPGNLQPASDGDEIIESVPILFPVMASVTGAILLTGLLMYQEVPRKSYQETTLFIFQTMKETTSSEITNMKETSRHSCNKEDSGPVTKDLDYTTTINTEKLCASLEQASSNVNVDDKGSHINGEVKLHMSPKEALKMKEFYLLSTVCICSYYPYMIFNVLYKTYGQTFIQDDTFLSTIGSVAGALHALSRVIVGLIQDKLSYKLTILLLLGIKTVLLFTLVATPYGGKVMYVIWICGLFTTFPLVFVCIPAAVAEIFGTKYTAEIFGMVFFTSTASSFLLPLVLHHVIPSLGWFVTFCITASISFIGILVTIFYPEAHRTQPLLSCSFDGVKEEAC